MRRFATAGFTLLELFVAIGIITILLALLIPAVSFMRQSAARAQCASNLRQLSVSILSYASDNASEIPAVYGPDTIHPRPMAWFNIGMHNDGNGNGGLMLLVGKPDGSAAHGYLNDLHLFRCPGDSAASERNIPSYLYAYVPNGGSTYEPWWYHPKTSTTQTATSYSFVAGQFSGFERHNAHQANAASTAILIEGSALQMMNGTWLKYHGKGGHVLFLDGHLVYGTVALTEQQHRDGKYLFTAVDQLANAQ